MQRLISATGLGLAVLAGLAGCNSDDDGLPQLAAARPGTLQACTSIADDFAADGVVIDSAAEIAAGTLTVAGEPVARHCQVTGRLGVRTGTDGQTYAIGFEIRLPADWNGRFYYQGNGGLDGSVVTAVGATGGGPLTHALAQGFAVLSSDAGHTGAQTAVFGFEPQARLDYGYQAAEKLTPVGKALVAAAYGRGPDRSYFGGCSNGGRHTLVATARLPQEYDGFLAGAPGYRLPRAAVSQIWGAQQYAKLATPGATTTSPFGTQIPDLSTGFTPAERRLVADGILARCDALDGAEDGIVGDTAACQSTFSLADDVPTCSGSRDGSCLTATQKTVLAGIFAGAKTSGGESIYRHFVYDPGLAGNDWAGWEFVNSQALDPLAAGVVFGVPPGYIADPLTVSVDDLYAGIQATSATYTESALAFMTPPNPADLHVLRDRGAKVIVYHGVSDAVFSYADSEAWYDDLAAASGGDASAYARLYGVPGMNHCAGGPSTDQFDLLTPLVRWVEQGEAPQAVTATARGAGNAGGVNAELPSDWSASRTRPLCPYPQVARYQGTGSLEKASSFRCER